MSNEVILRVFLDSTMEHVVEVPVTPDTKTSDVVALCAQPGEQHYHLAELWRGCERPIGMGEKPWEILQHWGPYRDEVRFHLRHQPSAAAVVSAYAEGRRTRKGRNGLRDDEDQENLPGGADLTLTELQEMAARQQRQLDEQQQLLVARQQRLHYLQQQETRHQQAAANENDKLRRMRERVDAQELKLRKLRAMRGHVTEQRATNGTLSSELEQIRALFSEKEKELSVAVSRVEELTRQLIELRQHGRQGAPPGSALSNGGSGVPLAEHNNNSPTFSQLDQLRKELMIRNKLNEEQSSKIAAHRELLSTRQQESARMDARIAELQVRLATKRALHAKQQQQKQQQQQQIHLIQQQQQYQQSQQNQPGSGVVAQPNSAPSAVNTRQGSGINTAAQGNHSAAGMGNQIDRRRVVGIGNVNNNPVATVEPFLQRSNITPTPPPPQFQDSKPLGQQGQAPVAVTSGYSPNKQDTKYQTLPHNIKLPGQASQPTQGQISTGAAGLAAKQQLPVVESHRPGSRNASPRPFVPSNSISNTIHTDGSQKLPTSAFPSSVISSSSSPTLVNVTSNVTMVTQGSPSIVYTSSGPRTASPKTSTPLASHPDTNSLREIFITGAPVVSTVTANRTTSTSEPKSNSVSSNAAATRTESPIYQLSGNKSDPVAHTQAAHQRLPSPVYGMVRDVRNGQHAGTPSSAVDEPSKSVATSSGPDTAPRQPPPYDFPHNRKTSTSQQPVAVTRAESASSLLTPAEASVADGKSALSRQANSDSQLLTDNSLNSALSVLKSGPAAGAATTQANATRPRFATRSAIANTYTNKLSSTALDQYRKNMNMLYSESAADRAGSPASFKPQPMVYDPNTANSARSEQASPAGEPSQTGGTQNDTPLGAQRFPESSLDAVDKMRNGPLIDALQNHDIDRAKLRQNAPRPLRRRLSSGSDSPMTLARHVNERNEARGMLYEESATSFGITGNGSDQSPSPSGSSVQSVSDTSPTPVHQPSASQPLNPPDLIRIDAIQKESMLDEVKEQGSSDSQNSVPVSVNNIPFVDEESNKTGSESHVKTPKTATLDSTNTVSKTVKGIFLIRGSRPRRNVTFDPLALLLDAALEGEIDLVKKSALAVPNPSQPNDEGITALHNAICAGHMEIVKFLVEHGCDVNSPDSDGWTPLHCAASCNNEPMVRVLVEHGACIFATTISDEETAAEKCEEEEEGFQGCSQFLYNIQEKLGIANKGVVYAVFDYEAQNKDELTFRSGDALSVVRRGDKQEKLWWWAKKGKSDGYIPRNLLGAHPRVVPKLASDSNSKTKK